MKTLPTAVMLVCVCAAAVAQAGEVGYVERFALADDRTEALAELIPGTEAYYYYHCLHFQNTDQLERVEQLLASWIERHGRTEQVQEIRNRQALLRYAADPEAALEALKQRLDLRFEHEKRTLEGRTNRPTVFDPARISYATLRERALRRHPHTLEGFAALGLRRLEPDALKGKRLHQYLERLTVPDAPGLVTLLATELALPDSRGFGSLPIHKKLTLQQLNALRARRPALASNATFAQTVLLRLQPPGHVDWRHDAEAREAYLDRLWAFASDLPPAQNSLKAHVLYRRLVHDRSRGVYDKERFLAYLALPRSLSYVNPKYLARGERREHRVDLKQDFAGSTPFPAIGGDETLVRSYLEHFFRKARTFEPYLPYIKEAYLKRVFAETKILYGQGDRERWASRLSPSRFRALKERVEIAFAPTNPAQYDAHEPVRIAVDVKNVQTLIVKVYEVNTINYYRESDKADGSDINLKGLVANQEKVHVYDEPPFRRVRRTFAFPALDKPGLYFVEFIGNGRSSRAIVRKGALRFTERMSRAGHVLTVRDAQNQPLPDAKAWVAGHLYEADERGRVVVPFTNEPGRERIVLQHGTFAYPQILAHKRESYSLQAGFFVEREQLQTHETAHVLMRPVLYLNEVPVTLSAMEEVTLTITSIDREGVRTSKEVEDVALFEDRETVHAFPVPPDLASVSFRLAGNVDLVSRGGDQPLSASRTFRINGIDRTDVIEDLHLVRSREGYALHLLGKSGEPRAHCPVAVALHHRAFRDKTEVLLQTDAKGVIRLGTLPGIRKLEATRSGGASHTWFLGAALNTMPARIHARPGGVVRVPYAGRAERVERWAFSLFEMRGDAYQGFLADRFDALRLASGFLEARGLAEGEYLLKMHERGRTVRIRVLGGEVQDGLIASPTRVLETARLAPLQIVSAEADEDELVVRLAHATAFSRVHVFATRFAPAFSAYVSLGRPAFPAPAATRFTRPETRYQAGRALGDEYRYILERQYAPKFPGNMLERPSLLLNPWARDKVVAGEGAAGGKGGAGRFGHRDGGGRRKRVMRGGGMRGTASNTFANLDFLAAPSAVLVNLAPDENGVVTVARDRLGAHPLVTVLAVDPRHVAAREVVLPDASPGREDLRLADALPADEHFAEQKRISRVAREEKLTIDDIATAEVQVFDTLGKVYALYATLNPNPNLAELAFVTDWPALEEEEKRERLSACASHELHLFLYHKDPAFFEAVVRPFLANKREKTFVDHWLLGDDLSAYLEPWPFHQLNVAERVLLARRLPAERDAIEQHVVDRFHLLPPDVQRANRLFKTALRARGLEAGDRLVAKAREPAGEAATPPPAAGDDAPAGRAPREEVEIVEEMGVEDHLETDEELLDQTLPFYRLLDRTEEWAESQYYRVPLAGQDADLVHANGFWVDYVRHKDGPFLSTHFAEASDNVTEMMLALAVLDLPFEAAAHASASEGPEFTLNAKSPLIAFHKEILPVDAEPGGDRILVGQNAFRPGERYRYEGNRKVEKYVTGEFVAHTLYGCQVVVTNPTSAAQKVNVLMQIPVGALPANNGFFTRGVDLELAPYATRRLAYHFYFPAPGTFSQFPVHVARDGRLVAFAEPQTYTVVEKPTRIDETTWDFVSQRAEPDQVLAFLRTRNLSRVDLSAMAWRMKDADFFAAALEVLRSRKAYDDTLWSYALLHDDPRAARTYLRHQETFLARCSACIDSPLLRLDPVERRWYQHLEYAPLVNARAHPFAGKRMMRNESLHRQYHRFLHILACRPKRDDADRAAAVYYLLLQDRVAEAIAFFDRIDPERLDTRLQYDYLKTYIAFYREDLATARKVAQPYADHPVPRWRNRFRAALDQLDEIEGASARVADPDNRTQRQTARADAEPSFDFDVEARTLTIRYRNLEQVRVQYYKMDIERLFSRNPFVQDYEGHFAYIRPHRAQTLALSPKQTEMSFDLPARFCNANVMIEVAAAGLRRRQAYLSNELDVQLNANYGRLRVAHQRTAQPLAKVYVKVYAKREDGAVRFYKDGYTDLRGRFDYTSLSTDDLHQVKRFAVLALSEESGAVIKEAAPPKR